MPAIVRKEFVGRRTRLDGDDFYITHSVEITSECGPKLRDRGATVRLDYTSDLTYAIAVLVVTERNEKHPTEYGFAFERLRDNDKEFGKVARGIDIDGPALLKLMKEHGKWSPTDAK